MLHTIIHTYYHYRISNFYVKISSQKLKEFKKEKYKDVMIENIQMSKKRKYTDVKYIGELNGIHDFLMKKLFYFYTFIYTYNIFFIN